MRNRAVTVNIVCATHPYKLPCMGGLTYGAFLPIFTRSRVPHRHSEQLAGELIRQVKAPFMKSLMILLLLPLVHSVAATRTFLTWRRLGRSIQMYSAEPLKDASNKRLGSFLTLY